MGEVSFKKGDYLYIGSAKSCLETRLQRHLRKEKRIFWHIDYFLKNQKAKILQIWAIDKKKTEKILKEIGFSVTILFRIYIFNTYKGINLVATSARPNSRVRKTTILPL